MAEQKWEYKLVSVRWDGKYYDSDDVVTWGRHITELGQAGWELDKPIGGTDQVSYVVFRRPYIESSSDDSIGVHI